MDDNFIGHLSALVLAFMLSACDSAHATQPEIEVGTMVATRTATFETVVHDAPPSASTPKHVAASPDSPEGKVQFAALLAREIVAAPERADKILRKHGLDRRKLDTMMFAIAADPELTEAYMLARRTR